MTLISDKLPKPHITRGVHCPWKCVSGEYAYYGNNGKRVVGVGATPQEAYDDWAFIYRHSGAGNL